VFNVEFGHALKLLTNNLDGFLERAGGGQYKKENPSGEEGLYIIEFANDYFKPLTNFVSLDFWLDAFFQWMMFFFASLSIIADTCFNKASASDFDVVLFNFLTAVRVVLC
jgi:hypothetical protein